MINKKILLVEDDPFLLDIYKKKFELSGIEMKVAEDGQEALDMVQQDPPDILLLDIVLPHIGGWEILRKIKSDKKFEKMQVVILSNLGQKEEVAKGLDLGAVKYLIKAQFTPNEIVEQVKKLLDN